MTSYFVEFQYTGIIGLISAVLGGLYTFGVGRLLNFAIQRTHHSDLRLRIAASSGLVGLVNEIWAAKRRSISYRASVLSVILLFTLAGKSISIIVTSGIKSSMGLKYGGTVPFIFNTSYNTIPVYNQAVRVNSSTMLTSLFNWYEKTEIQGTEFQVLANSTPGRIFDVSDCFVGSCSPESPIIPRQFYLIRQLFTFSNPDQNPVCEPTSSHCSLMSMRANLSQYLDLGHVLDAPIRVFFNAKLVTTVPPAVATANVKFGSYLAERPATQISANFAGSNDKALGFVAVTTASFQVTLTTGEDLVLAAKNLIGSANPVYTSIFKALNASALTPPLVGRRASNKATLVYNTATPKTDNTTVVHCIGYEANTINTDHGSVAVDMISCREMRFTVWTNPGSNATSFDESDFRNLGNDIFNVYNALAPTLTELGITARAPGVESIDEVAKDMVHLSKEIADRMYPFRSNVSAQVTPYSFVPGIQFELWSLIFMGILTLIVVVIVVMDMFMNDAVAKADLATLIENTTEMREFTKENGGSGSSGSRKIDWTRSEYPSWALIKQGNSYQVTLRRDRVGLESRELQKLNQAFP
ncbi:hypothetical protein EMPS_09922 [Entomortierella parvispora]|uniref:Uncharacterized protein n=1 Tax=Entomortierella parvispora TaxID=205924 RepID=A0A9P3HJA4_9FUNG|nr:hypothetical protein EMPS_09922 [Entomortierella parvispora]